MMHLFKGIRDTFENFEWNFRDVGLQRLIDFGDTCSKCYTVLGILFQIFSGIMGTPPPPSRASLVLQEGFNILGLEHNKIKKNDICAQQRQISLGIRPV